jgi:RNA polymerase sigma factor (sigma-70 family)
MAVTETSARANAAVDDLYRRHVGEVYRYTYAVLGNHADAEDVTQTTFVNALRALERGESPRNGSAWLIAIAQNVVRQRWRQAASRPTEVELVQDVPETATEDDLELDELVRALQRIPPAQREALVMRELEGRSYAEISELLGLTTSALETLLFRARRSLADEIDNLVTCQSAELAMSKQLDGRLSRKERRRLDEHLAECPDCARLAQAQKRQRKAFKGLAVLPVPVGLALFKGAPSASAAASLPTIGLAPAAGAEGTGSAAAGATGAGAGGTAVGTGGVAVGGSFVAVVAVAAKVIAVIVAAGVATAVAYKVVQAAGGDAKPAPATKPAGPVAPTKAPRGTSGAGQVAATPRRAVTAPAPTTSSAPAKPVTRSGPPTAVEGRSSGGAGGDAAAGSQPPASDRAPVVAPNDPAKVSKAPKKPKKPKAAKEKVRNPRAAPKPAPKPAPAPRPKPAPPVSAAPPAASPTPPAASPSPPPTGPGSSAGNGPGNGGSQPGAGSTGPAPQQPPASTSPGGGATPPSTEGSSPSSGPGATDSPGALPGSGPTSSGPGCPGGGDGPGNGMGCGVANANGRDKSSKN